MIEFLESRIAPAVVLNKAGLFRGANPGVPDLLATDSSGNIIVVGQFTGTIKPDFFTDVTPMTTADPAGDLYIAMYAPDFTLLWQNSWGGTGPEVATSVTFDSSGNVFIGGNFASTSASLGSSGGGAGLNVSNGVPQGFVLKINGIDGSANTSFNGTGAVKFGNGTDPSSINAVAVDTFGHLGIAGSFTGNNNVIGNASFGISATDMDGFYGRLDAASGAPDSLVGSTTGLVDLTFASGFADSVDKIIFGSAGNAILKMTSTGTSGGPPVTAITAVQLKASDASLESAWGSGGLAAIGGNGQSLDFAFDSTENLLVAVVPSPGAPVVLARFHSNDGSHDDTFAQGPNSLVIVPGASVNIVTDGGGGYYVGGETTTHLNYLGHFNSNGTADPLFGKNGAVTFGGTDPALPPSDLGLAFDAMNGRLILKDSFVGNPDVDPGKSVLKLIPAGNPTGGAFLVSVDPNAFTNGQSFTIPGQTADGHQALTIVTLTGPGYIHVSPNLNAAGNVDLIELFNTTLASSLTVKVTNPVEQVLVKQIVTHDSAQNMGSIFLDTNTLLNDGEMTAAPNLLVTGKINNIVLGDVGGNAKIKLGQDLPYNVPNDTTTPDTYNNKPNLTVHDVLGDNLVIENIGDGVTPGGVGGGGFGKIVFNSWSGGGVVRTTQGIGSFTILNGDFNATLEVDKFHLGENTTANVGSMTVQNGAWGSSGTEVEGNIGVFDVDAFLAGASITAGSVTKVITGTGDFNGTLTLTDTQAKGVATFTVGTNFQGHVVSNSPLKKLVIKGDFMGSLSAPSIASITAFSFLGTTTGDTEGDATKLNITTTAGLLGLITAKAGIIKDFEFTSPVTFSGMKVVLSKLASSTVGIENVHVAAHDIGPITVQLAANAKTAGVDLTGIKNSSFSSDGKVGAVLVKLSGASGASVGLSSATFSGASLANVTVNVSKGSLAGATAQAVNTATISSGSNIGVVSILGDATMTQASELDIFAQGKVTALNVKAKTAALGTLDIGRVLVGEAFNPASITDKKGLTKALAGSSIGAINISGSLTNTTLASGGNFAAVNIGGDMTNSTVIAGAYLGDDRALGGTNDVYHRAASIASITVKGAFTQSTIAAGINPGDNVIGNGDDTAAELVNNALVTTSAIKSISIGIANLGASAPGMAHSYGIEAQTIGKFTLAGQKVDLSVGPTFLDNSPTGEGAEDITVKLVIPV